MALLTTTIYLNHLKHNYHVLQKNSPNLAAVVKANAYGIGSIKVTEALKNAGCKQFFVATADEGIILRKNFPHIDIYVLDGFIEIQSIIDYGLRPVINTLEQLTLYAQSYSDLLGAIIHIDTGMNRLGIPISEAHYIDKNLIKTLNIDYLMTHFSASEPDPYRTKQQLADLIQVSERLEVHHISFNNSGGILNNIQHHSNNIKQALGRAGIALYGGVEDSRLLPVVSLHGKILQIKNMPAGQPVGYDSTYITTKPTRLITVAGGYADGIQRHLSNTNYCGYVHGYAAPLVGRVSMDTTIFDISDIPQPDLSMIDTLEFFGLNNSINILSKYSKTISYEIINNISNRSNINFIYF